MNLEISVKVTFASKDFPFCLLYGLLRSLTLALKAFHSPSDYMYHSCKLIHTTIKKPINLLDVNPRA